MVEMETWKEKIIMEKRLKFVVGLTLIIVMLVCSLIVVSYIALIVSIWLIGLKFSIDPFLTVIAISAFVVLLVCSFQFWFFFERKEEKKWDS
jgi:hypothetical protein